MQDFGDLDFVEYFRIYTRNRITELRIAKGVSEREMSLALGKGSSFINKIASGNNLPKFESFFEICEYFGVTPQEFFDGDQGNPLINKELIEVLNKKSGNHPERFLNAITKLLKIMNDEEYKVVLQMLEKI